MAKTRFVYREQVLHQGVVREVTSIKFHNADPWVSYELTGVADFVGQEELTKIQPQEVDGAAYVKEALMFADLLVITGDSTSDNSYSESIEYFTRMYGKVGIDIFDNAASGLEAADWVDNTGNATVNEAIAAIPGTGEGTVWQFCLGINDVGSGGGMLTPQQLVDIFTPGIDAVLAAKPDVVLYFVQPTALADSTRNDALNGAYEILEDLYGAYVVPLYQPMRDIYDAATDNIFYQDSTHPNNIGTIRQINIILNHTIPGAFVSDMTLDQEHYTDITEILVDEMGPSDIIAGRYWNSSGSRSNNASWASFDALPVKLGQRVRVNHGGNRSDLRLVSSPFDNDGGTFVRTITGTGDPIVFDIADAGDAVGINVDSSGAYTAPGDAYARVYDLVKEKADSDLTQDEINIGLTMRLIEA